MTDPFTLEIIREQLIAAAEESFIALGRSSQSPIIYEVLDYACAITDHNGDIIAQANGVPGFLGTLTFAVKAILEKFPPEEMVPGDVFMNNDPYRGGGNHLSDVALIAPIFYEGTLVAFAVNKAHWTEVGGMAAGSWTTDSTEIYQEGLQFPAIRLYEGGRIIPSLVDLIAANVRTPEATLGDMFAGVASLRRAEKRVMEICRQYGLAAVQESIRTGLDQGEILARKALAALPKGEYFAEEWMDDDGLTDTPVYVCVKVTISDDEFIADFTGSSPQVPGPINCTRTRLQSACRTIFKAITDPSTPVNDGWFRPVKIICPEGTVFTAQRPAPVSTYWETGAYAVDLLWQALFPVLPDRLTAGHHLSVCGTLIAGFNEEGERFILVEPQAGGWGAGATKDGENGLVPVGDGETYVIPVEVCETRYPILVEQYSFNETSAGHGRYRGGLGLIRDYRLLAEEAQLTTTFGRHKYPPWGANGGGHGSLNGVEVFTPGREEPVLWKGKIARYVLKKGDLARLITAVGGGYGHPHQRPVEEVIADVKNGYVSLQTAVEIYGVELDPATLTPLNIRRQFDVPVESDVSGSGR
ncbi:MAG: hydantoinase B/oxoprolinase family protein [Caldilineae bacterium]|nr:MAG: hydantoinase B/oxoprolinase family protein [Caldilineae bacterium]